MQAIARRGGSDGMNLAASLFSARGQGLIRWYVVCIASGMLNMLTVPELTLVFMGVVAGLGAAVVWMFWEIEQRISKPHRNGDHAR